MDAYPIGLELAAMGCTFYENFKSPSFVRRNNDLVVVGDCLKDGYFEGGSGKYLKYGPATWPFPEGNGTLFLELVINSYTDDARFFSTDHSGGGNYEFRSLMTAISDGVILYLPTGAGIVGSAAIASSVDFVGTGVKFSITWTWEYVGGDTYIRSYLNGEYISVINATFKTIIPDTSWDIGQWNSSYFDGEIHNIVCFDNRLTDGDVAVLAAGTIISDLSDKRSVASVPMNEIEMDDAGALYTPIYGSATDKKMLLGSNGLTPSEMPELMKYGGLFFNGTAFGTIPDSDDYTFSIPGGGDLSFSLCFYLLIRDISSQVGIIAKYGAGFNDAEYRISQSTSKIQTLFMDQTVGSYIGRAESNNLISGLAESHIITYDGLGIDTGIKLYRNGIFDIGTPVSSGVYTQMRNTTNPLHIGKFATAELPDGSEMYTIEIKPYEMSAAQAKAWDRRVRSIRRGWH